MTKDVIIIGAGGHAKVIADIIEKSGDSDTPAVCIFHSGRLRKGFHLILGLSGCTCHNVEFKYLAF